MKQMAVNTYQTNHSAGVRLRIVVCGREVGRVLRNGWATDSGRYRGKWFAWAWQSPIGVKTHKWFDRRGDAKRWVMQHQTTVAP